jgi:hypothetical protein
VLRLRDGSAFTDRYFFAAFSAEVSSFFTNASGVISPEHSSRIAFSLSSLNRGVERSTAGVPEVALASATMRRIDLATGVSLGRGLTVWAGSAAYFSHASSGKRLA